MTPERWQQVKAVLHSALERAPAERQAFLADACSGDEELRAEVESLIISHERAGSFAEGPAYAAVADLITGVRAEQFAGRGFGRYSVLERLGAGGMGEVYLAEDESLGRKVALKLLPPHLALDQSRLQRFRREARAASALNHPNILTIHEVGEAEGRPFIATEYVEGLTLRERSAGEPLKLGEALDIAAQVASALAEAHEAGIVHRDVKPENVMLRRDGIVKILDFGLAKLAEKRTTDSEASTLLETDEGVVMGTVAYMSPEQARGLTVDARTDIWSLGVVLYELVSGRAPFEGETATDVMLSIIEREPLPLARYWPEAPAELQRIITKALAKGREGRYQTVKDLLIDLRNLRDEMEFEARLERSAPSGSRSRAGVRSEPVAVAAQTGPATRPTSSAEYLIGGFRKHQRWAALTLAALLVLLAVGSYLYYARGSSAAISSVAVLPFVNAGSDPDTEYLSDGITESLINSLSRLPGLRVISRASVSRYKGREVDPQAVARELGVQAVLTGRAVQRGDSLLVSAELVDARDNTHLWGEQYNRRPADLQAIQQEIAREIPENLRLRLTGQDRARLARGQTNSAEAYQLYLKGRYFVEKYDEAGARQAAELFRQAIEKDPNYAPAYSGLADAYGLLDKEASWEVRGQRTRAAAMKALELDDTLAEAHKSLAAIRLYIDWDIAGAASESRRAVELNPSYAEAHHIRSHVLMAVGRTEEAFAASRRFLEVEPLTPTASVHMGWTYLITRQYDQAVEWEKKALAMDPNFRDARGYLGDAYYYKGMYDEAVAEYLTERRLSGDSEEAIASLQEVYRRSGIRGFLRRRAEQLEELSRHEPSRFYEIARLYGRLGKFDQAMRWLEKAYEEHVGNDTVYFKVEPDFDGLRSDPRFQDLARRMGLGP